MAATVVSTSSSAVGTAAAAAAEPAMIYGLELKARALAAHRAEQDRVRFLVGTLSPTDENQIHLVEYDEDSERVHAQVFTHPAGEVWGLSPSPEMKEVFAALFVKPTDTQCKTRVSLYRMPSLEMADEKLPLVELFELTGHESSVRSVLWHPGGEARRMASADDTTVRLWDLEAGLATASAAHSVAVGVRGGRLHAARWNPHQGCTQIAAAVDASVRVWDTRLGDQPATVIEAAHDQQVRDLDFNPNKQYYFVTCGDDNRVRFWDVRRPEQPLKTLHAHSHWVWSVRYNSFHDQLLLTCSSDSRVTLHAVPSQSSEPMGKAIAAADEGDDGPASGGATTGTAAAARPAEDRTVQVYQLHEDSVYAVEWSSADPWTFASLSYDGRLVIGHVPRDDKYLILL